MNVPETFFSVNEELVLFGLSCIFGAAVGVMYDVFRTLRLIFPHNAPLVFIEDVLFLCLYGISLVAFASSASRGELRAYFVIGNALGFILYFVTLGNVVIKTMKKLFFIIKKFFSVVLLPFRSCYVFLSKKVGVKFVGYFQIAVKRFKKIRLLLPKSPKMLYNKKENKKRKKVAAIGKKS